MRALLLLLGLAALAGGGGCGDECVVVSTDCAPLYAPTFDNVFQHTLRPTCGVEGNVCHGPGGNMAGLTFADPDTAYSLLVDVRGVVLPGDPGCSRMVKRVAAADPARAMPPGMPLSAAEQCAIIQWIAAGAPR